MRYCAVLLCFSVSLVGCWKSKVQLTKELHERKLFWKKERKYYLDRWDPLDLDRYKVIPPLRPSDSLIFYRKKLDTAEFHLDEIYDSLLELTGEWYGPNK